MQKRGVTIVLCVAMVLFTGVTGVYGSGEPIQITSDRLDAYDDKALVLFSGNVVATQDDTVIRADELYIYYDQNSEKKSASDVTVSGGKIEKIELKGNVTVKRGERTVSGDRAVLRNAEQTVVMTGHAVMREGNNVITGDKITVFLKENRGIVESSGEKKRVTAVIYPQSETLQKDKNNMTHKQAD